MSAEAPRALVVTSPGAPAGAVTPVLAAMDVAGLAVRAIDVGRVGSRSEGAVDRMLRALVGELAERRLVRELGANPPDVAVAFDPGSAQALSVARDEAARPSPVIAVITELEPAAAWAATDADRYLVVDDEAAVTLADHGVEGERILVVGPVCEHGFAAAGAEGRAAVRARFSLGDGPMVLVEVAGLGYDTTSQLALQLSLAGKALYLFDAGDDSDAATALRRQVPTLGMRAKLFGRTDDAPYFWRAADVVVGRPRPETAARVLAVGGRLVSLVPEDKRGEALARALEARGLGATASSPLLVSSALEPLLAVRPEARTGGDGAANVADVAWIVGAERGAVVDEARVAARQRTRERVDAAASAAEAAARSRAAAGGLEDLSGGGGGAPPTDDVPDPAEFAKLRAELATRQRQVSATVRDAGEAAARWSRKVEEARAQGDDDLARESERNADGERARMHAALAELAQIESELKRLERAERAAKDVPPRPRAAAGAQVPPRPRATPPPRSGPSVDDLLDQLKRQGGAWGGARTSAGGAGASRPAAGRAASTVDDELEALKRKMAAKKKK
jgi:UDP-N-acetylglucosamine:LPS N-acetylglucosamine transferase